MKGIAHDEVLSEEGIFDGLVSYAPLVTLS